MKPLAIALSIAVAAALLILSCFPGNTTPLPETVKDDATPHVAPVVPFQPADVAGCKCALTGTACLCSQGQCRGKDCWNYQVQDQVVPTGVWKWRKGANGWGWVWYGNLISAAATSGGGCANGSCGTSGGRGRGIF